MTRTWMMLLSLATIGCDGPDEYMCEIDIDTVSVCVDMNSRGICKDLEGDATASEEKPGGPYTYCEDLFPVDCLGSVPYEGDNYSTSYRYWGKTQEDCDTANAVTAQ